MIKQPTSSDDPVPIVDARGRGFFAVDARVVPPICTLGVNPAVAYVVLAAGTGKDQAQTFWSVHAIEKYTGISRQRAKAAVELLVEHGHLAPIVVNGSSGYRLCPSTADPRASLTWQEQEAVNRVTAGHAVGARHRAAAERAAAKAWLHHKDDTIDNRRNPPPVAPAPIWLPNSLVTGVATETPPLERVRQMQDSMALRLFVELYGEGHPRADGGINRQMVWQKFERERIGQQGQFVIWGFRPGQLWMKHQGAALCHLTHGTTDARVFFRRLEQLQDVALVEWMPHLVEGGGPDAEMIHPYGLTGSDSIEDRLGRAAHAAALSKLTEAQRGWVVEQGYWLAPVPRHMADVQMVGIARLRYRAQTRATAAWWSHLQEQAETHLIVYGQLGWAVEARKQA